jgi:hypothetical protein
MRACHLKARSLQLDRDLAAAWVAAGSIMQRVVPARLHLSAKGYCLPTVNENDDQDSTGYWTV